MLSRPGPSTSRTLWSLTAALFGGGAVAASCSSNVDTVFDDGTSSSSSAGVTTGTAGTGPGGTSSTGTPFTCADCAPPEPICVDQTSCAAVCPDARAACHTSPNPADPAICCPGGDQCCAASPGGGGADLCHPSGEPCPIQCPGGDVTCGAEQLCALDAETGSYSCVDSCNPYYLCNDLCCPLGSTCEAGACVLADLTIDVAQMESSAFLMVYDFQPGSCSFFEGCIGDIGPRTLLRFDLKTPNVGDGDLFLGDPTGNPLFIYSSCHDHYHFEGYARYRLLDTANNVVATGHKQAFCLLDWEQVDPAAPDQPAYDCQWQGIQKGWADTYESDLPCQWVDVTGVPPGDYLLEVVVNGDHTLGEKDYSNNTASIPITIN